MKYLVSQAEQRPEMPGQWEGPTWDPIEPLHVANFRPESSDHRPNVQAKLLYDREGLYGLFRVEDRYVRCVHTQIQDSVCRDSCVEFFVQPDRGPGYFNFEMNAGGNLLCYYIADATRQPGGFKAFTPLTPAELREVRIAHSLPSVIDPEIATPVTWTVQFAIPLTLLERYAGPLGNLSGRTWRANFYKCGDQTSHPHWASWAPVDELNFHLPRCFGTLLFA